MPCTRPLMAWPSLQGGPASFKPGLPGYSSLSTKLPCGQCQDCRASQTLSGATRCMGEVQTSSANAFITLTYSDDKLWSPMGRPSIHPRHLQLFHKKFRRAGHQIRYYACGEYGAHSERPHYHGIYFGYWPDDAVRHGSSSGNPSFTSESLSKIWGNGHVLIEHVTLGSASYVAGYVGKKLYGRLGAEHYSDRFPPFVLQSQSLGRDYLERYLSDVLTGSVCVPNSDGSHRPVPVPRPWLTALRRRYWVEDPAQPHTLSPFSILKRIRSKSRPQEDPDYYIQYRHELSHELITRAKGAQTRGVL